jgi:hypothetical protein
MILGVGVNCVGVERLYVAIPWVSRVWDSVRERVVRRYRVVGVLHHGVVSPWCLVGV